MSNGTQIYPDMTVSASLPTGSWVPFVDAAASAINYRYDLGADLLTRVSYTALAASGGAALVGWEQSGTGAVLRTVQDKLRETVSITDYGGDPSGATDSSTALDDAIAALGSDGGEVFFPIGDYKLNNVITQNNIVLTGEGGHGDFNTTCIRPNSIASPPLTFTGNCRGCGLKGIHVSGADGTAGSDSQKAKNAPYALLLTDGVAGFHVDQFSLLYNGKRTLGLVTTANDPVFDVVCEATIRNDIEDGTGEQTAAYYQFANNSSGYITAVQILGKLNISSTGAAWAAILDGSGYGAVATFDGYWDIRPDLGVLCKTSVLINGGVAWYLDPGTTGAVIITTDFSCPSLARILRGELHHGGQKWDNNGTEVVLPNEVDTFAYKPLFQSPYVFASLTFGISTDPFNASMFFDLQTDSGPLRWNGCPFKVTDTTDSTSSSTGSIMTLGGIGAAKSIYSGDAVGSTNGFYTGVNRVVSAQQAAVPDAAGGATVDAEARAAINALLARLRTHGLIAT